MADRSPDEALRALRVNQLDASQLDSEVVRLLKTQLRRAFQYFESGFLSRVEPELNALLRLLVWRFSLYSGGFTVGQGMLNMKYKSNSADSSGDTLSVIQKLLFGFAVVGAPYIRDRSTDIRKVTDRIADMSIVWRFLYAGEKFLQVASLLNFLVFLQKGQYSSLLERFLGIQSVFAQRQSIRQVSFEYMTRELLWHGFAEFLFFLLPLINVRKLKNVIGRQFSRVLPISVSRPVIKVAYHECGICGEAPTAPHQGACDHVFCYYCIKGNSLSDAGFPCPLCGEPVGQDIKPVECTVALEVT